MKKKLSFLLILLLSTLVLPLQSCRGGDDEDGNFKVSYDVIKINGIDYACYGYKYILQTASCWEPSDIMMRCQKISSINKYGEPDYDFYAWIFQLKFPYEIVPEKGMKLEDYDLTYEYYSSDDDQDVPSGRVGEYQSGSATITDVAVGKYVTVKFNNYTFNINGQSLTINGTVQLTDAYTE